MRRNGQVGDGDFLVKGNGDVSDKQTFGGLKGLVQSSKAKAGLPQQAPSAPAAPASELERAAALTFAINAGILKNVFTGPKRTPVPVIALAWSKSWTRWVPPLPPDMAGDAYYLVRWISVNDSVSWLNLDEVRVGHVQTVINKLDEEVGPLPYDGNVAVAALTQAQCLTRIDTKMTPVERELACQFLTNPSTTIAALELARDSYTFLGYANAAKMAQEQLDARNNPPLDNKVPPLEDKVPPIDDTQPVGDKYKTPCAEKGQKAGTGGCCPGYTPNDAGVCDLEPNTLDEPCGDKVGPCASGLECKAGKCALKAAAEPESSNAIWWVLGLAATATVVGTAIYFGTRSSSPLQNPVGAPFKAAYYENRAGWAFHPRCYLDATKTIDGKEHYGPLERMRDKWPKGAVCVVCGKGCAACSKRDR